jgi:CheY-like chemotaxis protein
MAVSALVSGAATSPSSSVEDGRGLEALVAELEGDLVELRRLLAVFAVAPSDVALRDRVADLVRKLAVKAAGFDWPRLAADLSQAEAAIKGAGVLGYLADEERDELEATFDAFADALHSTRDRENTPTSGPVYAPPSAGPAPRRHTQAMSVPTIVVGGRPLVELVRARGAAGGDGYAFSVRHVARLETAHANIRQAEPRPEVVVVDADEPLAERVVEDLLADARTEAIPIVVVGTWRAPEQAARYVALGVARCLAKPVASGELRQACALVAPTTNGPRHEPLGRVTLDELGARLASELHQSLCDAAADDRTRRKVVDLADGSAILTVMWDAVARVRELVGAASAGEIRFRTSRRDEALPTGLALERSSGRAQGARAQELERGHEVEALEGLTAVVAVEDLSTNWFLCGVLRDAGLVVHDVFSGAEALDVATRVLPDVLVTGVGLTVSPGRSLARSAREDALLRDVPILLVGGDAALLRRAEELGEPCDGALPLGVGGELALQRIGEVTRPRARLAARLAEPTPRVQGRLDGFVPTTLLALAARTRPDCRILLQAGDSVFEVDLRKGHPVRICRSLPDGSLLHGAAAFAALLAVGAGRFEVERSEHPLAYELTGSLGDLLAGPANAARKWHTAVVGAELFRIGRIAFDESAIVGLLEVTPEPARSMFDALLAGRPPRDLVLAGEATQSLVERVLVDIARRQGFVHIDYVTAPVVEVPLVAAGEPKLLEHASVAAGSDAPAVAPAPPPIATRRAPPDEPRSLPPTPSFESLLSAEPIDASHVAAGHVVAAPAPVQLPPPRVPGRPPERAAVKLVTPHAASESEQDRESFEIDVADQPSWASPVARVPHESDVAAHADEAIFEPVDEVEAAPSRPSIRVSKPPRRDPEPVVPAPRQERRAVLVHVAVGAKGASPIEAGYSDAASPPEPVDGGRQDEAKAADRAAARVADVDLSATAMPSSFVPRAPAPSEPRRSAMRFVAPAIFVTLGISLAVGARWWRYQELARVEIPAPRVEPASQVVASEPAAPPVEPVAAAPVVLPPEPAANAPGADAVPSGGAAPAAEAAASTEEAPAELALTPREQKRLSATQGLVEIVAGKKDEIFVDGKRVGQGPVQRVALHGGDQKHEVRVKMRGEERVRYVTAKAGAKLRLRMAPPWSR